MKTFWQDSSLDRLPLPTVGQTCDMIRELATPFVENVEEQKKLLLDLALLRKKGEVLQTRLSTLQQDLGGNRSWLRAFWDDTYTSNTESLAGKSNYAFQLNQTGLREDYPLEYVILELAKLAISIEDKTLIPEKIGNQFLSMEMFQQAFYTRIPGEQQGGIQRSSIKGAIRIGVVHQGTWYLVTIADEKHHLVSPVTLAAGFQRIKKGEIKGATKSSIGAMTTMVALEASQFRNQLQKKQVNRLSLTYLEATLFTVTLDDKKAETGHNSFLFGEAENRWFFKSLQVIQLVTGEIGFNFEHAGCDGSNWLYLLKQLGESKVIQDKPPFSELSIYPLKWQLSDKEKVVVKHSAATFKHRSATYYTELIKDKTLTRQLFKGQHLSPDACLQLALMAAYYHQTGQFPSSYESVSMRHFFEGRTEVARPMTNEAHYFIASCVSNKNSDVMTYELLLKAIAAHKKVLKQNQTGQGAERHLLAMASVTCSLEELSYLAICHNSVFKRAVKNNLSTSSLASPLISQFIFSPVIETGLGIGYGLLTTGLQVAITGKEGTDLVIKEYGLLVKVYLKKIAQLIKRFSETD